MTETPPENLSGDPPIFTNSRDTFHAAFCKGRQARLDLKGSATSPYPLGSTQNDFWCAGYAADASAQEEARALPTRGARTVEEDAAYMDGIYAFLGLDAIHCPHAEGTALHAAWMDGGIEWRTESDALGQRARLER